ncbi:MAG: TadE/TadG family type IV pilus assembly protein, partial [Allosphingosinicella sp.]
MTGHPRLVPAWRSWRAAVFARRLGASERGVSLIEFALSLPVVLAMGFGGLEVANLALTHMRVSQIANMVADNAGRVRTGVDETDINEIFAGVREVGAAIRFPTNGRIVLSSLEDNGRTGSNHGQMINWQRCLGTLNVAPAYGTQGTGRTNGTLLGMGPAARRIQSLPGTAVMFVEVSYTYQPLIPGIIPGRTIRYESAFNVRERTNQNISNTQ